MRLMRLREKRKTDLDRLVEEVSEMSDVETKQ
jgi:hypothetical protein